MMGDRVTIPRTMAGLIGVADVQNSVKRHYLAIPLNHLGTTSRTVFGGNSTTGLPFFQRNVTFEKLYATAWVTTTVAQTTGVILRVYAGATTVFDLNLSCATTISERWVAGSTAPNTGNANVGSSSRIRLRKARNNTAWKRLSVVAVFREALDS
jgi:hypothetical protein